MNRKIIRTSQDINNITITAIAKRVGVSTATVSTWFNEVHKPREKHRLKLFFIYDLDFFIWDSGIKKYLKDNFLLKKRGCK